MTVSDSETKFVDKAGLDHTIDELKKLIEDSQSGDVDLSDYVTQEQLQAALDSLDINIDLSAYATKAELQQAIASIDLSGYATTAYVDNAIANIPSGGDIDLSNYYTKAETYNKEEVNNLIPTVTNGTDGQDGEDGITPHIDATTKHWFIGDTDTGVVAEGQDGQDGTNGTDGTNGVDGQDGFSPTATVTKSGNIATITITDKNGTTTTTVSDGKDGAGGGSSGGSGEVYSTEETAIGTWIDGRVIYRKTFVLSETLANTVQFYEMNTEFEEIISINAINNYNSATFKPLNICEHDTYFNLSSNSVSNIKSALTKKCMVIYVFKDDAHPFGRIYTWLGDRGGTLYKVYVTVEYIKPTSNVA